MHSSDMPDDGMTVKIRNEPPRLKAGLLLALTTCGGEHLLAALDAARRQLDHVAPSGREMRAEPKFSNQHDLVTPRYRWEKRPPRVRPDHVAFEGGRDMVRQIDAMALIAIEPAAKLLGSDELRRDRAILEIGIVHRKPISGA